MLRDLQLGDIFILGKRIHRFLQVEESLIHIFRPGIFHCDTGRTGFNNRRNLCDIALTDSHRLHVLHKLFLDLFRRTLAGLQLDEQPGIIQVGQQVDTQLVVGNLSQQQDGQHDHTDSDRIAYRKFDNVLHNVPILSDINCPIIDRLYLAPLLRGGRGCVTVSLYN